MLNTELVKLSEVKCSWADPGAQMTLLFRHVLRLT
jgi:hypothetical protein